MKRLAVAVCLAALISTLVVGPVTAAPGDLDPSFGQQGIVVTPAPGDDLVNGLVIDVSGRMLVGGSAHNAVTAEDFSIWRYTKRGEPDPTFGGDGQVVTTVWEGGNDHIWQLVLQPDGRIVAAGTLRRAPGAGGVDFALARYMPDGALDTSFGGDGIVTHAVGDADDFIQSAALQPDGKIVVGGTADMGIGAGGREFVLARYEADGDLDPTFGGDGIVTYGLRAGDGNDGISSNALVILSDGRILAGGVGDDGAGAGGRNFAIIRLLPNGDLDETFGSGGKVSTAMSVGDFGDSIVGLAVQPDGSIVAGGQARSTSTNRDFGLALFTADGAVTKKVLTDFPSGRQEFAFDLALQADGRIVVAGLSFTPDFADGDFALARYLSDGTRDESFGVDGLVTTSIGPNQFDTIFAVEIEKTGKIVATGECDMGSPTGLDVCVARYKAGPGE